MDAQAIAKMADALIRRTGVVSAWSTVFVPALQDLGERWARERDGIVREHLVSGALVDVLDRHSMRTRAVAPGVLAVAAPGEQHTLPLRALRAGLAEAGTGLQLLDAAPAASIGAAMRALTPRAVVVWAQVPATAATPVLGRLVRSGAAVYAAGPGWARKRLPSDVVRLDDLAAAVSALNAWST
jgi:MerR family transcriptional regulator, light-induced transcriptional regulator